MYKWDYLLVILLVTAFVRHFNTSNLYRHWLVTGFVSVSSPLGLSDILDGIWNERNQNYDFLFCFQCWAFLTEYNQEKLEEQVFSPYYFDIRTITFNMYVRSKTFLWSIFSVPIPAPCFFFFLIVFHPVLKNRVLACIPLFKTFCETFVCVCVQLSEKSWPRKLDSKFLDIQILPYILVILGPQRWLRLFFNSSNIPK